METRSTGKKVWDPLVRLCHWSLVAAFVVCYVTQEQSYEIHLMAGYIALGIVLLRILWGFIGSRCARFTDFVRRPAAVLAYLGHFSRGRGATHVGHNPAGGYMILALLLGNLAIGISGIALDAAENRAGPLAGTHLWRHLDTVNDTHLWATNITLALVLLHVLGVLTASIVYRENLVRAMITGRKRTVDNA